MYRKYIKRVLDVIISLFLLLLLSPVILITALMVCFKLGRPVVFKQNRPGIHEKIFTMYKFRSMSDRKDSAGKLLPDSERLTGFGIFLRKSSLDELPGLWNILKGDLSLVGPRPQLVRDLVFMNAEQKKRQTVRQGLTGLAQVNGRNNISWEQKLEYDLTYIQHITFWNDVKIVCRTVGKVVVRKDINAEGMATAEDFGDYLLRTGRITQEIYNLKMEQADLLMGKAVLPGSVNVD